MNFMYYQISEFKGKLNSEDYQRWGDDNDKYSREIEELSDGAYSNSKNVISELLLLKIKLKRFSKTLIF